MTDPHLDRPMRRGRGAPIGNTNALKHGRRTKKEEAMDAEFRACRKRARALIAQVNALLARAGGAQGG